ncbi:hypothetical protein COCNU_scaffold007467G000020 [Cocos nucifera]|nr:hypothetical protein [Cocos nucifera]
MARTGHDDADLLPPCYQVRSEPVTMVPTTSFLVIPVASTSFSLAIPMAPTFSLTIPAALTSFSLATPTSSSPALPGMAPPVDPLPMVTLSISFPYTPSYGQAPPLCSQTRPATPLRLISLAIPVVPKFSVMISGATDLLQKKNKKIEKK